MNGAQENSVLRQISARLKTSSAVVPALLASLIAMPIGATGLMIGPSAHSTIFGIALLSPLFILLVQISFFTAFDRDRLHNEEHIERRMVLDQERSVIGDNSQQKQITLNDATIIGGQIEGGKNE